jgi:1-acyl-sn-glycerol-3-phosphate acyltransferase
MTPELDRRLPEAVARASRVLGPVTRTAFRYAMHGLENVPAGPCLLVGNHSGAGVIEVLCMLPAWHARFGEERPVYAMANKISLSYPAAGPWLRSVGAVPASYDHGRAVLSSGKDVLAFPGGDVESFRPFYQPRKVVFGKRRGYVRLALETGVPIVPIATLGAHHTYLMAPGNAWLAKKLGLKKRLRLESVPVTLGAAGAVLMTGAALLSIVDPLFAIAFVVGAALPLPVRITSKVLPPIDLKRAIPAGLSDAERVESGHDIVFGALQAAVAEMTHANHEN